MNCWLPCGSWLLILTVTINITQVNPKEMRNALLKLQKPTWQIPSIPPTLTLPIPATGHTQSIHTKRLRHHLLCHHFLSWCMLLLAIFIKCWGIKSWTLLKSKKNTFYYSFINNTVLKMTYVVDIPRVFWFLVPVSHNAEPVLHNETVWTTMTQDYKGGHRSRLWCYCTNSDVWWRGKMVFITNQINKENVKIVICYLLNAKINQNIWPLLTGTSSMLQVLYTQQAEAIHLWMYVWKSLHSQAPWTTH